MSSAFDQKPCVGEDLAELADLSPEDGAGPVLDVEVVVLDVREHGAGEPELPVEGGSSFISGQERPVFGR